MTKKGFWHNNAPIIVFVPLLIGLHYGWFALQERIVPKNAQVTEQPIITVGSKYPIFNFDLDQQQKKKSSVLFRNNH